MNCPRCAVKTCFHHMRVCLLVLIGWGMAADTSAQQQPAWPYLGRLTTSSVVLNIIAAADGASYYADYRGADAHGSEPWRRTQPQSGRAGSPIQWQIDDLSPGREYQYRVRYQAYGAAGFETTGSHRFRTMPAAGEAAGFALFSDAHITPGQYERMQLLSHISRQIEARNPDFVMMLGDNIQTFNSHGGPMEAPEYGPLLYRMFRQSLGELPAGRPCFFVNGNWEGENGWHPEQMRRWAQAARQQYIPNPVAATYPRGGSEGGDYYAFSWGDVLCIVLNVTGYTPADHSLGSPIGRRDDWTLGRKQKEWLHKTLKESHEPWKLIFMHHPAGGGSPNDSNARYGRGGGLGAGIGEQAELHQWMRAFGVQALFYGHDHVFTDMKVDGIHYVCAGSAGAPWKFGREETGYEDYWTPFGHVWVETGAGELAVSFVATDGSVLHRFAVER